MFRTPDLVNHYCNQRYIFDILPKMYNGINGCSFKYKVPNQFTQYFEKIQCQCKPIVQCCSSEKRIDLKVYMIYYSVFGVKRIYLHRYITYHISQTHLLSLDCFIFSWCLQNLKQFWSLRRLMLLLIPRTMILPSQ